jgi:signal transduction histidine kinase
MNSVSARERSPDDAPAPVSAPGGGLSAFDWGRDDQTMIAAVLDLVAEGIVLFDAQGRFVFCNETFRSFYGLLGDLLVPGTPFADIIAASVERGQLALTGDEKADYLANRLVQYDDADQPHEQQLSDGRWLRIAERRLGNGYVLGTRTDITEMKMRERAAQESEQRLADAVEALQEGFALFGPDDRLVICNDKYKSYFPLIDNLIEPGVPFGELIHRAAERGQNVETMTDPGQWIEARLSAHARAGGTFEHKFSDGRYVWVSERKTRDGSTLSTYIDITELKLREQELEQANRIAEIANRAKSDFLANMSHELRTPLNAIIGFTEVMCRQMLGPIENERYRSYLDSIFESGSHLLRMVNDLLDFEKMESQQASLDEDVAEITEIVASSISLLSYQARKSEVALFSEMPETSPRLKLDELAIKKALINIIANALKYTPAGGAVAVVCKTEDSGDVAIRVTDTGIGIPVADLERVLIPFFQSSGAKRREGTGLGLSITKSLIDRHGGKLDIASAPGEGTTVTITLPRWRVVGEAASPDAVTPRGAPPKAADTDRQNSRT